MDWLKSEWVPIIFCAACMVVGLLGHGIGMFLVFREMARDRRRYPAPH